MPYLALPRPAPAGPAPPRHATMPCLAAPDRAKPSLALPNRALLMLL